ncbi:MAG: NAD(P)/FAD-dependent oxidoreductase [Bacillota bacterium]|nr:NAD(P)/FAD-dependent oxidoreductase [Bacillota bacterium]
MKNVLVVGGGPAGMMAAAAAAEAGCLVTLIEKNKTLGKKLLITGKGRCNVTNNCSPDELIANLPINGRFLYSAVNRFSPSDTMDFFDGLGLKLKTERGNRVFPESDHSADVLGALKRYLHNSGVNVVYHSVTGILTDETGAQGVKTDSGDIHADAVIIATGGLSYPLTGSTGDGYDFAGKLGHTIVKPKPSLVPIETAEEWPKQISGLALKNIAVRVTDKNKGKTVYEDFGELLFTHFGVSGPVVLSMSSHIRNMEPDRYTLHIDLKPALSEKQLDARLLREFDAQKNKNLSNVMPKLLPSSLADIFLNLFGIEGEMKVNEVTKEIRQRIISSLKDLPLNLSAFRPIDEAIVTSGGVKTSEINPATMESKLVPRLYFAGEIIDVDGYTGGFNLQIAFSTGRLAGQSASR